MSLSGGVDWVIGIGISLGSSTILNLGLNIQKLAHNRMIEKDKEDRKSIYGNKLWIFGFTLFMFGNIGTLIALGFAAASIITPLGSFSLVCNGVIAPWLLGEKFTRLDGAGTLLIICGSILAVISGPKNETEFTLEDLLANYQKLPFLTYISLLLSIIFGVYMLGKYSEHKLIKHGGIHSLHPEALQWRRVLPLAYAGLGGVIGSQTVLTAKSCMELLKSSFLLGKQQFNHFFPWIIVAVFAFTIVLQIHWINVGLRYFEAIVINPFYYAMWTVFSIIGSNMYFDEFVGVTTTSLIMFLVGVMVSTMGVYLLSMHPPSYDGEDGDTSSVDSSSVTASVESSSTLASPRSERLTLGDRVLTRMARRKGERASASASASAAASREPTPIPLHPRPVRAVRPAARPTRPPRPTPTSSYPPI